MRGKSALRGAETEASGTFFSFLMSRPVGRYVSHSERSPDCTRPGPFPGAKQCPVARS